MTSKTSKKPDGQADPASMVIIIDSREQKPYTFPGYQTTVGTLPAGDYSIAGGKSGLPAPDYRSIVIERKTKSDAYCTIGQGRDRFTRELEKLATYRYSAIVLECSMSNFLIQPPFSKLNAKSAINSLLAWSIRYGVHVWFADGRQMAQTLTLRLLEKFWKEHL